MKRLHATVQNADHFVERQPGLDLKLGVLVDRALDVLGLSDPLPRASRALRAASRPPAATR